MSSPTSEWLKTADGALIINKPAGISSFGVIEALQRKLTDELGLKRRDQPKMGHGGTLDPFATGVLVVCCGRGVKLARYFLGSIKEYEGVIIFGQSTDSGDPTGAVIETSTHLPTSIEEVQAKATSLTLQPYLQTPPMYSAKKKDGKPLYELARQGIEIEREAKACQLYEFEILSLEGPRASFRVRCSSGTYIRTLAQDLARLLGTVGMLQSLRRSASGALSIDRALELGEIQGDWTRLRGWIPFHQMLSGYIRAEASAEERLALIQGRQNVLFDIVRRVQPARDETTPSDCLAVYSAERLVAIARKLENQWTLERVFTE
jgi:tRNA pseudouridine55 synthase